MKKAICFAALATLAGCAATPDYDRHFGEAVRQARTAMTMHPQGTSGGDVEVKGIGGQPAATALARYHESFKAPPPPQPVISMSASASSGSESK